MGAGGPRFESWYPDDKRRSHKRGSSSFLIEFVYVAGLDLIGCILPNYRIELRTGECDMHPESPTKPFGVHIMGLVDKSSNHSKGVFKGHFPKVPSSADEGTFISQRRYLRKRLKVLSFFARKTEVLKGYSDGLGESLGSFGTITRLFGGKQSSASGNRVKLLGEKPFVKQSFGARQTHI